MWCARGKLNSCNQSICICVVVVVVFVRFGVYRRYWTYRHRFLAIQVNQPDTVTHITHQIRSAHCAHLHVRMKRTAKTTSNEEKNISNSTVMVCQCLAIILILYVFNLLKTIVSPRVVARRVLLRFHSIQFRWPNSYVSVDDVTIITYLFTNIIIKDRIKLSRSRNSFGIHHAAVLYHMRFESGERNVKRYLSTHAYPGIFVRIWAS